jgi:hypothetical protein
LKLNLKIFNRDRDTANFKKIIVTTLPLWEPPILPLPSGIPVQVRAIKVNPTRLIYRVKLNQSEHLSEPVSEPIFRNLQRLIKNPHLYLPTGIELRRV